MKKSYEKPRVELIEFALSTSIAADCTRTADGLAIQADWNSGCDFIDGVNGICYHVPSIDNAAFMS